MASYLNPVLPSIALKATEIDVLWNAAEAMSLECPRTTAFLKREIERAEILHDSRALRGLVSMNSKVTFRDDVSAQESTVVLVYPQGPDATEATVSVVSPLGAALIGMSVGQTIDFHDLNGKLRSFTVLDAVQPSAI